MSAAGATAVDSTTPEVLIPRSVRLIRAIVLFLGGIAITFTATLHEQITFDLGMAAVLLGAVGIANLIEWFARRTVAPSVVPLLLAIVAIVSAVVVPFVGTAIGFAVLLAAWALGSALLEFIGAAVRPGSRQDSTLLGGVGVLLSILVLLLREDPVATIGLLGAYAIIAGVFLGISAFDTRRGAQASLIDSSATV